MYDRQQCEKQGTRAPFAKNPPSKTRRSVQSAHWRDKRFSRPRVHTMPPDPVRVSGSATLDASNWIASPSETKIRTVYARARRKRACSSYLMQIYLISGPLLRGASRFSEAQRGGVRAPPLHASFSVSGRVRAKRRRSYRGRANNGRDCR